MVGGHQLLNEMPNQRPAVVARSPLLSAIGGHWPGTTEAVRYTTGAR
jgi:hypothetical protein